MEAEIALIYSLILMRQCRILETSFGIDNFSIYDRFDGTDMETATQIT